MKYLGRSEGRIRALPPKTKGEGRRSRAAAAVDGGTPGLSFSGRAYWLLCLGVCLFALLGLSSGAGAAGVVTNCNEAALRAALTGGGTVTFSNDCSITLSQQILINQPTTIDSLGHNVSIGGSGTVPLLMAANNLTLRGLTLTNGRAPINGGALYVQAGAVVIATRCSFANNSAFATNGLPGTMGTTNSNGTGNPGSAGMAGLSAAGGAIYNAGDLALVTCVLSNNTVTAGGGGTGGSGANGGGLFGLGGNGGDGGSGGLALGGAVYNLGNLTVINCLFTANNASGGNGGPGGTGGSGSNPGLPGNGAAGGIGYGGAIYNGLNLTLVGSTFATNSSHGGISAAAGTRGNGTGNDGPKGADASGGALFNAWWAVVTNSTFYTNVVLGGAGGNGGNGAGTFHVPGAGGNGGDGVGGSVGNANTLSLVNCTFSSGAAFGGTNGVAGPGNFPASNGNPGQAKGANVANSQSGVLVLINSIFAAPISGNNTFGTFADGGYNLSPGSDPDFGGTSQQNTDPKLGPLAMNGGPTPTMALLPGSPAIDFIPAELTPPTDQRGFPRPVNGAGDVGSFEFGAVAHVAIVNLSLNRSTAGMVQLSAQDTPGFNYSLQASTNLVDWQVVATNLSPVNFTDAVTNLSARFYRLTR